MNVSRKILFRQVMACMVKGCKKGNFGWIGNPKIVPYFYCSFMTFDWLVSVGLKRGGRERVHHAQNRGHEILDFEMN